MLGSATDGLATGAEEGPSLGVSVGVREGVEVGESEGEIVGSAVGALVGGYVHMHTSPDVRYDCVSFPVLPLLTQHVFLSVPYVKYLQPDVATHLAQQSCALAMLVIPPFIKSLPS
jgi:hypothetical protein